jgi:hypothetical protein
MHTLRSASIDDLAALVVGSAPYKRELKTAAERLVK